MKYEFDTTTGEGSVIVTVVMEYERVGIFTDKQFKELEMEGTMRLSSYLIAKAEEAKIAAYESE